MKNIIYLIRLYVFLLLIIGLPCCSNISTNRSVSTKLATLTETQTTPTMMANSTPSTVTDTPSILSTPQPMGSNTQKVCITAVESQDLGDFPGTIIVIDDINQLSLRNSTLDQDLLLGKIEILYSALSNGHELAYIDTNLNQLLIVSPNGEQLTTISAMDNWVEVLGWIGLNKVLVGSMPLLPNGGWNPPSNTLVVDIVSGEYQVLIPDYPEIFLYGMGHIDFGRFSFSITAYDSTLTRVVYPSYRDGGGIILWDIVNKHEITRLYAIDPWNIPRWNTDGSAFIISLPPQARDSNGNPKYIFCLLYTSPSPRD